MKARAEDIINIMEKYFPLNLAEDWDNAGLQIGSSKILVNKLLIALDIDEQIIKQATDNHVDMIITHHPLFFKPIKSINYDRSSGNLIKTLIQGDITVYSAHTNLDAAEKGLNQLLAEKLGLIDIKPLGLTNEATVFSLGRKGQLNSTMSLQAFALETKKCLGLNALRVVGDLNRDINRVAVVSGSGASYITTARVEKMDVLVTGDIKYHEAKDAIMMGIAVIDAGHQGTEEIMVPYISKLIQQECTCQGYEVDIIMAYADECLKTI